MGHGAPGRISQYPSRAAAGTQTKRPSYGRVLARRITPAAVSDAVDGAWPPHRAPETSEHQSAANRGRHAAPVRLRPIGRGAQRDDRQHRDGQRPLPGAPGLQHPAERGREQSTSQPHSPDWLPSHLAKGEEKRLSGRVLGSVAWHDQHVRRFEELRQRRTRIGQPAMREGVGAEQVAELVMDEGIGYSHHDSEDGGKDRPRIPQNTIAARGGQRSDTNRGSVSQAAVPLIPESRG